MKLKFLSHLGKAGNTASALASKNSPAILAGLAIAGVVVTVGLAMKAAPEIKENIDELNDYIEDVEEDGVPEEDPELMEDIKEAKFETLKKNVILMLPTFAMALITILCIIASLKIGLRRQAALAAAYNITANTLDEYKDAMKEKLPEKKVKEVEQAVVDKELSDFDEDNMIHTGKGDAVFKECITGRYFRSSPEAVRAALKIDANIVSTEGWLSLTKYCESLCLPPTDITDDLGFDSMYEGFHVDYSESFVHEKFGPVALLKSRVTPRFNYGS